MMDDRYIRTHDIVGRYLLRQLSDEEQSEFEQYYFEHPEMLKELELERALREALRDSPELTVNPRGHGWGTRWLGWMTSPTWCLAATAAALALAALLLVSRSAPPRVTASPIVADLELVRMRGTAAGKATVRLPAEGLVAVSIDAAGLDSATVDAVLQGPSVSETLPLAPDEDLGLARIAIPANTLPSGEYVLSLSDASGRRLKYEFTVTR